MRLKPGALVVLEGLDRAGKSTQQAALASLPWEDPRPAVVHMPSGETAVSRSVYEVTERQQIRSSLARQLLHLACHAENVPRLKEIRRETALVLDRWWWSTVAYGWFAGGLRDEMDEAVFFGLIETVWTGMKADLLFLFTSPFEPDALNVRLVSEGYAWLADRHREIVVEVPPASPGETTEFLVETLRERGLSSR